MTEKAGKIRNLGGQPPGEAHPMARLTEADVLIIRALVPRFGVVAVAADYEVTHQHVSNIFRGKRWRHI